MIIVVVFELAALAESPTWVVSLEVVEPSKEFTGYKTLPNNAPMPVPIPVPKFPIVDPTSAIWFYLIENTLSNSTKNSGVNTDLLMLKLSIISLINFTSALSIKICIWRAKATLLGM